MNNTSMKPYALTFPQLIAQAMAHGLGDDEFIRLRAGYDLAERMADGLYRSQGCAFINHLVRTSSIVLAYGGSINQALAAMLHSAYMLDCFYYSRRRAFKPKDRVRLSAIVGAEIEEIVWEYSRLAWGNSGALAMHLENLPTYSPVIRSVLFARIANELEDFLDLAVQYRAKYNYRNRIAAIGGLCIDLAKRLDVPDLGRALDEVYAETLARQTPAIAVREHIDAYELPRRHYNEQNIFEYGVAKAGRLVRRLLRNSGRR